jgi:hypothetical protein
MVNRIVNNKIANRIRGKVWARRFFRYLNDPQPDEILVGFGLRACGRCGDVEEYTTSTSKASDEALKHAATHDGYVAVRDWTCNRGKD